MKHQHCDSASRGPNAAKKIVFAPDGNNRIAFPPDSSFFFSNCRIADIQLPKYGIDVSNVTDMTFMFAKSEVADPDVSEWDTAKVTKMVGMFDTARKANPNVKKWNTSSVTDMTSMFYLAKSAKPEVGDWDTSKVTDFSWMFYNALSANPDVSKWNTGSATHLGAMFWGAKSANPDVSRWDTKNVEYLTFMFERANNANPDVSRWDVRKVKHAAAMFQENKTANPDVSKWDLASLEYADAMFKGASAATYIDITNWSIARIVADDVESSNGANDAFATTGRTTIRLKGSQLRTLAKKEAHRHFGVFKLEQGVPYNIFEEGEQSNEYTPLYSSNVDGFDADRLLRAAEIVRDDAIYLIQPADIKEITVRANPVTIYAGEPLPRLTYTVSPAGMENQLEGELDTSYSNSSVAGEYPIKQGGLRIKHAARSTYVLKFIPATVTAKNKPPQPPAQVTATNWVDGAKDCNSRKVSQSRTVTTTPYKWDSGKRKWVLDTGKASKRTENRQRDMNDGEHRQCTPQPPAQVTATNWVDGAKDCNSRKVSQSRTVTTTPYKWDSGKRKWVLDTGKASKRTENRQRDMNDGEHRQCTPQPPAQVTATNWVDGAKDCNSRKVSQSRTVTTTPYKWDSGKRQWVLDTSKASKRTENRQRDMNDGEHKACSPQPPAQVTATNWADGVKDCNTRKVTQSRTVTTTPYRWDSSSRKWVLDTAKASKKTESRQRDMNDGEHKACSPQPNPQVTATNWVDGAKDCNSRKVSQSRTVTTTPYKWDSSSRKWVPDNAAATKKTENRQRDMNDGEHRECTPQPQAQVTETNWVDGAKDCNSRKVPQSRTVTTTPYKWDSSQRKWVLDTGKASKKTETRQRDMNDAEHQACTPRLPVQVTSTEWVDGAKDCNTRKVTQSRTVTTTPTKWDSSQRKWVLDSAASSTKTETRERDMDEREVGECVNVALTVSHDTLTVVKGQPVLQPLSVEATSTTDAGLISLQTVCAPKHEGQADTDQNGLPAGVELVRVKQAPNDAELAGNGARTVGEVDGNATQAELGTYRCWVYATKPGITIDPLTGAATGPNAVEGVGWARKPLSVEVVQPALPKTGQTNVNYLAGSGALMILALTGGWWITRRKKGVGRRA